MTATNVDPDDITSIHGQEEHVDPDDITSIHGQEEHVGYESTSSKFSTTSSTSGGYWNRWHQDPFILFHKEGDMSNKPEVLNSRFLEEEDRTFIWGVMHVCKDCSLDQSDHHLSHRNVLSACKNKVLYIDPTQIQCSVRVIEYWRLIENRNLKCIKHLGNSKRTRP